MADIHIRNVDDELFRRLKVQAASEGVTLKSLVLRLLGRKSGPAPVAE